MRVCFGEIVLSSYGVRWICPEPWAIETFIGSAYAKCDNVPNLIHSTGHAFPSMCEGQAKVYLERTIPTLFGRELPHSKLWTMAEGERFYDVHQVQDTHSTRREKFYFDVSAFFGKSDVPNTAFWLDLPEPNRSVPVTSLFSREELCSIAEPDLTGTRHWIDEYQIRFKQSSSEQNGHRIAALSARTRSIEVAPVRTYVNQDIPFLHGFRFYRLFIVQQIIHWHQGHDVRLTELGPRRDGRLPRPGVDCIAFKPLAPYDFCRDFLNFMFWTHQPDAFQERAEVEAFAETARFAVRSGLFTARELRAALMEAGLSPRLRNNLKAALGGEASVAPRHAAVERRLAH